MNGVILDHNTHFTLFLFHFIILKLYNFSLPLVFFFAAIKIVKKIKDVTSLLDGTASFEMSLSHDNIPVTWMYKGVELKSSEKCKISSERKAHKLILQNVDSSNAGEYTAKVGHLQCSATLTVEGT